MGCDSSNTYKPTLNIEIKDLANNPDITNAVQQHLKDLKDAGVKSVQIKETKESGVHQVCTPGLFGDSCKDVPYSKDYVEIHFSGGNTKPANDALEKIASDLRAKGIEVDEGSELRCSNSPTYLHINLQKPMAVSSKS